jgi:large-conductance mechanosensitive channel
MDWLSLPGLIGAAFGLAIGWIDYRIVVVFVERSLRKNQTFANAAEGADFERRIVIMRWALFMGTVVAFPIVGYLLGVTLFG